MEKKFKTNFRIKFCAGLLLLSLLGCNQIEIPEPLDQFRNLDDTNTTSISANIPRIEVDVNGRTVTAKISVTDQQGLPLENFRIGNYRIVEKVTGSDTVDVNAQLIEASEGTNLPLAISAVMDYSGSMSALDIRNSELAMNTFVGLKSPDDIFSIVKFSSSVQIIQDFTSDADLLRQAVDLNYPDGGTAFYDACEVALNNTKAQSNVVNDYLPVIIGFTDGEDTRSVTSLSRLVANANGCGIPVYSIGIGGADRTTLNSLSNSTGGRASFAPSSSEIGELYNQISQQLTTLYTAEWNSSASSGTQVTVVIDVEYTSANGTFTDRALTSYIVP
ncbi:MAG: hypothetical protein Roseis2KO_42680 [Roseivirga sp.]